ncbi:transposase family protein [Streptomyces sp. M2CJ-2]|uniref:transposase family protein n=1 Tax=Streptomyces sp. M2CJ-2 TaxID=2803948 RepID=UPI0034D66EF9
MPACRHDGDGRGGCRHPNAERPWSYLIISVLDAERSRRSHGPGQRYDVAARPRRGVRRTCRAARGRRTPGPSVTADESARACPACGAFASRVRGSAVPRPRDLPYGDSGLGFLWHKRRWFCREPRCPRRSFTGQIAQIPAGAYVMHLQRTTMINPGAASCTPPTHTRSRRGESVGRARRERIT